MMIFTYFHKAVSIQYIYITYRQFRIPVPFQPIIKLITHRYVTPGVFHFRARAVIMRNRVPLTIFPNVAQD